MRHVLPALAALVALTGLAATAPAAAAQEATNFRIADPTQPQRVDWLVVAGTDELAAAVSPLAAYRKQGGLAPGIVTMATVRAHFDNLRAFLRHALANWTAPAPRFLLLVGDVETVPAEIRAGEFTVPPSQRDLATDFGYACPNTRLQPELHVGRFPADTPEECAAMAKRTILYGEMGPGAWQHKVAFVTGEAGFNPQLDRMIEQMFIRIVAPGIPAPYAIELAYANPRSPYCPDPFTFNAHALELLNAGSLFYVYVGHGYRNGLDRLRFGDKRLRILDAPDAPKITVRQGRPVMFVIACSTGRYDHPQDCVGEVFFKRYQGPVAFLGGSRVTQPYCNGLLGKALVDQCFGDAATLGEAVTRAKQQVLAHAPSPLTQQADFMASMMQGGAPALPKMRRDGVRHYNLFGDPALALRKPAMDLQVELAGDTVTVRGAVERCTLTLEVARGKYAKPLPPVELGTDDAPAQLAARYRVANDPVLQQWELTLAGGAAHTTFARPAKAGTYYLKARTPGHAGAAKLVVKPPEDDEDF